MQNIKLQPTTKNTIIDQLLFSSIMREYLKLHQSNVPLNRYRQLRMAKNKVDPIYENNCKIKNLSKYIESIEKCLRANTTWIKFILIKYFMDRLISKENKKTVER